jgi:hypothetical protein
VLTLLVYPESRNRVITSYLLPLRASRLCVEKAASRKAAENAKEESKKKKNTLKRFFNT